MHLNFHIHYQTQWGQQIAILYSINQEEQQILLFQHTENGNWFGELFLKTAVANFSYQYVVCVQESKVLNKEFGKRHLQLNNKILSEYHFKDSWRSKNNSENALYCTAFEEVIFRKSIASVPLNYEGGKITLQLRCPQVAEGQVVALLGSTTATGKWDYDQSQLLNYHGDALWSINIEEKENQPLHYKYGIYDEITQKLLYLEEGNNRYVSPNVYPLTKECLVVQDEVFRHKKELWRGTGIAMPVFGLRSENSLGVGEFSDIKLLVDWAKKVQYKMVQILPVNDTIATHTWVDSYPYAAISVFALHPQYLRIDSIKGFSTAVEQKVFEKEKVRLNGLDKVDYEAVMNLKLKWARQIFKQEEKAFLKDKNFQAFLEANAHWLKPYAAFCYLRDKYDTPDFKKWKTYQTFSASNLKKICNPKTKHFSEVAFYYFLQYQLDLQLGEASAYARQQGIVLKGDIPIGIYRYSVDAWVAPELYNMDGQAGAPPDPFSELGQNWGFPTYNWDEMAKNDYEWWKNRFQQLARYFDAFRIDHILGFFRIWEIPLEQVQGTMGHFNPALPIRQHEFAERGISFDFERYCEPYIPEYLLHQSFGNAQSEVVEMFFDQKTDGFYKFKSIFDTQQKIKTWIDKHSEWEEHQDALFYLASNVLFFMEEGAEQKVFHPRIDFLKLPTFTALDADTKQKLEILYNNYFYHRQEEFWRQQAMTKLPALKEATKMLICGEDLGMVPESVPGVMSDLGILSLEIQRMSKTPTTEFLKAEHIPYLSVASPSTHDMSPIRLWWEELKWEEKRRFLQNELGITGEPPYYLEPWLATIIIKQHLDWKSMWIVFPLQDILAIDDKLRRENPIAERINVPANPQHYWRYRMHLTLEQLLLEDKFNQKVERLIIMSGRA